MPSFFGTSPFPYLNHYPFILSRISKLKNFFSLLLLAITPVLYAGTGQWTSPTLSSNIPYTTLSPTDPLKDRNGKFMTIVYLENLGFKKISQHSNDDDVQAMVDEGYRVIRLDYQGNAKAISPGINQDIISINDQLNKGSMCGFSSISPIRSYILMEGYRIRRDVSYYLDDPTVYNWPGSPYTESQGDSLYMDIIYPTSPSTPVPVLLSFSYSNSYATLTGGKLTDEHYHQRLFLGYTLSIFDDSILEGAPAHGIAWAIADHPKYCDWGQGKPQGGNNKDYGSIETNPDAVRKVKSAVRTLRSVGESLGLNGEIAIFGFSRGATAGSLAIGNLDVPEFQDASRGLYPDANDHVQAAILGPGVFDYTLLPQGRNEYKHATAVWGDLSSHREEWEKQGGSYLCTSSSTAPTLFFYNSTDDTYYGTQVNTLKDKLEQLNVDTDLIKDFSNGHAVPNDASSLQKIYDFLTSHLSAPETLETIESTPSTQHLHCSFDIQGCKSSSCKGFKITDGQVVFIK